MKVTCFDVEGMKCMNIHGENAEENALISRLNIGVDQHRNDGSEERHIQDIKEDKYHDIADLAIPGVPETYEDFTRQVKLHEDEREKELQEVMRPFKGGEVPSEDSDIEPPKMS